MNRKILVMGLPGSGKTTFTRALAPMLNAVVFNNDEVRANINRDLGFSMEDRVEQARRMGWLCDRIGPRRAYTWLLVLGSLPVMGIGLAHSYASFLIFRLANFYIGTINDAVKMTR